MATVALAVGITACGSDSTNSDGSSATDSQPTTNSAEPSGAPIVIGTIGSYTGDPNNAAIPKAVTAWQSSVNANGGINGHPVTVKVVNDQGDAAKALQGAKQLVEQDHVMAVVGEHSNQVSVFQKYLESKGVPAIGGESYSPPMTTSPDFFPSGGNLPATSYGIAVEAKKAGKTKFAMPYCAEAPVCATLTKPFGKMLTDVIGDMSLVYTTKVAANAPSFTAQCIASQQAGADAMFIETFAAVITRVLTDCTRQNYKPGQYNIGSGAGNEVLANPNAEGMTVTQYNLPIQDTTTPGGRAFNAALDTYAPGLRKSPQYNDNLLHAWTGLQLFKAAAEAAKVDPDSTSADLKQGLYALKDETLDGLAPPLTFIKGKPTQFNCYFVERVQNKTLVPLYGGKAQCVPPADEAKLLAAWG